MKSKQFSKIFLFQLAAQLDLKTLKRCIVTEVEDFPTKFEKILHIRDKKSSLATCAILKHFWYDTKVSKNDTVSIQGSWDSIRNLYNTEIIVTSPDTLVSGTTVVGSLFCPRKSVLAEKFKSLDTGEATAVSFKYMKILDFISQKDLKFTEHLSFFDHFRCILDQLFMRFFKQP